MIPKFAASNDLKISQVEIISQCEGLLNFSLHMHMICSRICSGSIRGSAGIC